MNADSKSGFALISVLVIAFALFILLSSAFKMVYSLHKANRRIATELQGDADNTRIVLSSDRTDAD